MEGEPEEVGIRLMEESEWKGTAVLGGIDGGSRAELMEAAAHGGGRG